MGAGRDGAMQIFDEFIYAEYKDNDIEYAVDAEPWQVRENGALAGCHSRGRSCSRDWHYFGCLCAFVCVVV
eukprot:358027-Rhodomonas_salina.1